MSGLYIDGSGGGGGAVTIADGADVTQGAIADVAWSGTGNSTVVAALKAIWAKLGAVVLGAGTNTIGAILGKTSTIAVTPTVTANTYTAGYVLGGVMQFSNVFGSAHSGIVETANLTFNGSTQTAEIDLYVFKANPSNGTYTDHVAPTWNSADAANLVAVIPLISVKSGLGTMSIYTSAGLGLALNTGGTDLWVIAIAAGALNAVSAANSMTVTLTTLQD